MNYKRISLSLALATSLLVAPGCAKRHYKNGNDFLTEGKTKSAIAEYSIAARKKPTNVAYLSALGQAYLASGDYAAAAVWYTKAAEQAPQSTAVLEKLGYAHAKAGQLDKAVDVYWQLMSLQKKRRVTWEKLLTLLEGAQRYSEAAEATILYSKAEDFILEDINRHAQKMLTLGLEAELQKLLERSLEISDKQPDQWRMLGDLRMRDRDFEGAIEAYSRASALNARDLLSVRGCAFAQYQAHRYEDALPGFQRLVRENPAELELRLTLIDIYLQLERLDEANAVIRETQMQFPDAPEVLMMRGALQLKKRDYQGALDTLSAALVRTEKDNARLLVLLGEASILNDEQARGRRYLDRALAVDPNHGRANLLRCQMDLEDGREQSGIARCERAMNADPSTQAEAVAAMTAFYERQERYILAEMKAAEAEARAKEQAEKKAKKTGTKASGSKSSASTQGKPKSSAESKTKELREYKAHLEQKPADSRTAREWFDLGQTCLKLNEMDEAEAALTRAWKLETSNATYRMEMARVFLAQGKAEVAIVHLQEVVRSDATDIPSRYLLAKALLAEERSDDAIQVLREVKDLDPNNYKVYELLSEAYFQAGMAPEAERYQAQALEMKKKSPAKK